MLITPLFLAASLSVNPVKVLQSCRTPTAVTVESAARRLRVRPEVLRFGLLAAGHVDLPLRLTAAAAAAAAFRRLIYEQRMGPFRGSGLGEISGRRLVSVPVCGLRMSVRLRWRKDKCSGDSRCPSLG